MWKVENGLKSLKIKLYIETCTQCRQYIIYIYKYAVLCLCNIHDCKILWRKEFIKNSSKKIAFMKLWCLKDDKK